MKTHRVKPKNSLGTISGRVFFPGWNKLWYIVGGGGGEVKNPNVFFPGNDLRNRFSSGNFPGWIQPGYWDRVYEWQQVTVSGITIYNKWVRTNDNEWYNERQRVVQRETTSGTTRDNKWQQMTASHNEWLFWLIFLFFWIGEEPTAMHPKENSLNIKEDPEERLLN